MNYWTPESSEMKSPNLKYHDWNSKSHFILFTYEESLYGKEVCILTKSLWGQPHSTTPWQVNLVKGNWKKPSVQRYNYCVKCIQLQAQVFASPWQCVMSVIIDFKLSVENIIVYRQTAMGWQQEEYPAGEHLPQVHSCKHRKVDDPRHQFSAFIFVSLTKIFFCALFKFETNNFIYI